MWSLTWDLSSLLSKKYEGLDGTELAVSESQERMAVVVTKENADEFIRLSNEENLEESNSEELDSSIEKAKTIKDLLTDQH